MRICLMRDFFIEKKEAQDLSHDRLLLGISLANMSEV